MDTLVGNAAIRSATGRISIGEPMAHGGLTVVPITDASAPDVGWLLLEDALVVGAVELTEVNQGGSVPTLLVRNVGDFTVLLLDGEELVGAKQNRILNTTVLVGARKSVEIPVSCVEAGRWAYRTAHFGTSGRTLYASVRRKKTGHVHDSLRRNKSRLANQAAIWDELADKESAFGVSSPTAAMRDVFETRAPALADYQRALGAGPGQVGAVIYGGASWWGLDLLADPRIFAKAWPRLLSGYAMDSLMLQKAKPLTIDAGDRLDHLLRMPVECFPGVGLGEELRFRDAATVGAALVVDDRLAHLMAFPTAH
jgi:hypothetical protein